MFILFSMLSFRRLLLSSCSVRHKTPHNLWNYLKNYSVVRSSRKMHSLTSTIQHPSMIIEILPALSDNYMYLIIDSQSKEAAVVDPVDPDVVSEAADRFKVNLTKIFTTHHHWDHAGGNKKMCEKFKNLEVIGGDERIEGINRQVSHEDIIDIGNLKVKCLATPCHTSGHICYFIDENKSTENPPVVFTGDTLFIGGCGRFFEGTAEQMYKAFYDVLGKLPDSTQVHCGHEYTIKNLEFGLSVEPDNKHMVNKLEATKALRHKRMPATSTLNEEKKINPFMRVHEPTVMKYTSTNDPIQTMQMLRKKKDTFTG